MLVPGTQMHLVTFVFICIEVVILFYLFIHSLARPDDKISSLDISLIVLLITYNITGGLLPDHNLPGSYFIQNSIAYGTGFMTPCYFPYYVYKAFGLEKMKFHAHRGVFYLLVGPYILFVLIFKVSDDLNTAKNILILPAIYALWVVCSLIKAVRYKYSHNLSSNKFRREISFMFLSIISWVCLPAIDYFGLGQVVEVSITNTGFLLLLGLHMKNNIELIKAEHQRLVESEIQLQSWNERLNEEIKKRTIHLNGLNREERFNENCMLYHLTKREKEIIALISEGYTHKVIGEKLFISENTVRKHSENIFKKVQVSSKMELCKKLGA